MVAKKSSPTKGTAAKGNNNSEAKVDAAPEPKQPKTRIVIADDHAVLRESLAALLSTQQDFSVEGTAADGMQALELVQKVHPDVLVLDLFMPGSDGFEVLRTLDKAGNRVATVVLTGSESESDYTNVVRLGGRGLVLKSDGPEKLFTAVRTVAAGELAFSDDLAQRVLSSMAQDTRGTAAPSSLDRLSERERQIAFCVARGQKNKDISAQLNISENTVKRHLQSIFNKTGARDRLELAVLALNEVSRAAA
jgi:two-component system nitrate/nitrite response regulator NarL